MLEEKKSDESIERESHRLQKEDDEAKRKDAERVPVVATPLCAGSGPENKQQLRTWSCRKEVLADPQHVGLNTVYKALQSYCNG